MGFKDNLLRKIQIGRLADQVRRSLKPADPPQRIDREAMRALLQMSTYTQHHERDLELFSRDGEAGKKFIIVLDNELKRYHTTIEDVALRKSPTVKEMVSIRNAIKILNDKDVVTSAKTDTLQHLQDELIASLDLAYTPADIAALEKDGRDALKNNYTEGIVEVLTLFADLLGLVPAPKAFQMAHCLVWGALNSAAPGVTEMGPSVIFDQMHNSLKMIRRPIRTLDAAAMQHFQQVGKGESKADLEGEAVLSELKAMVPARKA
ncbi:MAG: hypothetical protein WAU91_15855 [Desulfatitalea sp.]